MLDGMDQKIDLYVWIETTTSNILIHAESFLSSM